MGSVVPSYWFDRHRDLIAEALSEVSPPSAARAIAYSLSDADVIRVLSEPDPYERLAGRACLLPKFKLDDIDATRVAAAQVYGEGR